MYLFKNTNNVTHFFFLINFVIFFSIRAMLRGRWSCDSGGARAWRFGDGSWVVEPSTNTILLLHFREDALQSPHPGQSVVLQLS
jgi:hypothetical protein